MKITKDIGNRITSVLYTFYKDNNGYPDNLSDLVPDYIPFLPKPVAGQSQWYYSVKSNTFIMGFGYGKDYYPAYFTYSNDPQNWQSDF